MVLAGALLGVGHAVPELERALEQRARLAVRVDALGRRRRVDRPLERGRLLAGGGEVVGDGGGQHGAGLLVDPLLQRARQRQVERRPLAGQQVVLHDLAQERVPEAVAAVVVGDEDVAVDGLAQRVAQRALVEAAGPGQQRMVGPLADGDEPQDLLRGLGQVLDAQHQRVAQRVRRGAAAVEPGGEQLLAVQRVAARARPQPLEQVGLGRRAEDVGELAGELLAGQRLERDAAGARVALDLGQQRAQRVAAVQLVGPVGADQEHALGHQAARQEGERRPRRAIGPVQVLDQEQHRALLAERVEQREQTLEQSRLGAVLGLRGDRREPGEERRDRRADRLGQGRVARAGERAQRGDERHVGQLALAEVHAVAGQHQRAAVGRLALELGEQARLADARLAGQEHDRGPLVGGLGERGLELRQLGGTADQPCARDPR